MDRDFEYGDPNDPYTGSYGAAPQTPQPPPSGDPWTPQELAESQNWANQYYASHQIPSSYGTPDDIANSYVAKRRAGMNHADAMGYLQTVPGLLGWDKYKPAEPGGQGPGPGPGTPPPGGDPDPYPNAPGETDDSQTHLTKVVDNIPTEPGGTLDFYPAPDPFEYPDFNGPRVNTPLPQLTAFDYPDMVLPSGQEVLNEDPGYGLRKDQGNRAIMNNALARGLGKSTGTMKSLADYAESLGSQEYGAAVDRRSNLYTTNRGNAMDKWNSGERNKLTNYALSYGADSDAFGRAEDTYKTNLGKAATTKGFDLDIAAGKAGGRQGASTLAGNLALGSGNLALGQGNLDLSKSNSLFDHLLSLYDISTRGLPTPSSY